MYTHTVVFICPSCGRAITHYRPTYYEPNTICKCGWPDYVTQMVEYVFPREKVQNDSLKKENNEGVEE